VKTTRLLFVSGFLLLSGLCFAQPRIRVIGAIPCAETGTLYRIQIGAFRIAGNAEGAAKILAAAGFSAGFESLGNFTRVFVPRVPGSDIPAFLKRLERAGFTEAIIRKEPLGAPLPPDREGRSPVSTETAAKDPPDTPEIEPGEEAPEPYDPQPVPVDPARRTELLCRSWRSVKLDGKNIQGTAPDHVITFSADGTFSILYMDSRRSTDQGQWKWKDDVSSDFLYSWNDWKTFAVDRILELSENILRDQWGLENLDNPQIWESLPRN
jgi:hypothetical protein